MADDKENDSRAARRYGSSGKDKKDEPRERAQAPEERGEASDAPRASDDRKDMAKRHEKEHRDLHGQHREAMRQMHARHEAEMAKMNERQDTSMTPDADADGMSTAGASEGAEV